MNIIDSPAPTIDPAGTPQPLTTPAADTTGAVGDPAGTPRLLTIAEAASATGASTKAIARRIERGTLRAVHDNQGRRVVPRTELERVGLLNEDGEPGNPGGELVIWRDLYQQERANRETADQRALTLERDLVAIANAGPLRALKLRRQLRRDLDASSAPKPPAL